MSTPLPRFPAPVHAGLLVGVEGVTANGMADGVRRVLGDSSPPTGRDGGCCMRDRAEAPFPECRPRPSSPEHISLMLATQVNRYEEVAPLLSTGCSVVEQCGVYAAAVHRGLLHYPANLDAAYRIACGTIQTLTERRPLPDVVFLANVLPSSADTRSAKERLRDRYQHHVWRHLAALLFGRLAAADQQRFRVWSSPADGALPLEAWIRGHLAGPVPPRRALRHDHALLSAGHWRAGR
ncbi:hypothetical protein OG216_46140 (plasmid) [Streptomycetaceae bacterium NBC_01309]